MISLGENLSLLTITRTDVREGMSGMEGGKTCRSLRVIHLHVQDDKAEKVVVVPTEAASRLTAVVQLDDGVSLMLGVSTSNVAR